MSERYMFGTTAEGERIDALRIFDAQGNSAVIIEYGASIQSLVINGPDGPVDVILGYDTVEGYEKGNSYSGATVSYTGYDGNDYSARSFNTRMENLGQPDIIFVFGATNDSWAGTPIGEYKYENITYGDLSQFRPALARMLQWMTDRYINTEIYFLLNNDLREEIDESVKTICARYNVPVIELENIDKLSGHPSVKGMRQIADQVNSFIKKQHKISSRSH